MSVVIFFGLLLVVLFGVALGSFLNVVVLRWPDKLLTGRSYCPNCKKKLSAWELIPIFSYLFILGRCIKCKTRISAQYPLVEFIVGVVAAMILFSFLKNPVNPVGSLIQFFIVYVLIILFLIDLRTFLLPDLYILILTGLAILNVLLIPSFMASAFGGALIGSGFLLILWIITKHRGIGFGDVKLMVPLGLYFGVVNTVLVLYFSFIIGGLVGILLLVSKKATMKTAVPFGPFLAGVAILYILFPGIPDFLLNLIA